MPNRKAIELYCAHENIARFAEQLASSTDTQQIEILHHLLDEEQQRLERLMAGASQAADD
jgi:succinate dehydrogenase flavin-adding protein (antitoxin of CptAB toxin-antitoxin module)